MLKKRELKAPTAFDRDKLEVELDETGTTATISYDSGDGITLSIDDLRDDKKTRRTLKQHGFKSQTPDFRKLLRKRVYEERLYNSPVLPHPGYHPEQGVLVLRSGDIIREDKAKLVRASFSASRHYHRTSGSTKALSASLVPLLVRQDLMRTLLLLPIDAMVGTVLREPPAPIIEIIGDVRSPDAPARLVIDLVQGSIDTPLVPATELLANYDRCKRDYSAMVIPVGDLELALAADSDRMRQGKVLQTFNQALGVAPTEDGEAAGRPPAHVIFGRKSLTEIAGRDSIVGQTIADGIVTLRADQAGGLSDEARVVRDHGSVSAYNEKLKAVATNHQGILIKVFAERFLKAFASDAQGVKDRRRQSIFEFRKQAGVDVNDAAEIACGDFFGRLYATYREMRMQSLLKDTKGWKAAILRCYRNHLDLGPCMRPVIERLEEIAARPDVVDIRKGERLDPELVKAARIFVKHGANGRELWIAPSMIMELFPDWRWFKQMPEAIALMVPDSGHKGTYRSTKGRGGRERFVCFRLPNKAD